MVDTRFFHSASPIRLSEIAALTGASAASVDGVPPDDNRIFYDVAPLDRAQSNDISFLDNIKYTDAFTKSKAGACFVRPKYTGRAPAGMALLITENPYYAYAVIAQHLYPAAPFSKEISPHAVIADSAVIGKNVRIDAGAVIAEKVKIGNGCWIGANSVIGDGVEIGDDSRIGPLCTISHAILGQRVLLHRGIHVGQDGFGFAASKKGIAKVPQLGRVLIGDDVEIGSGTCVDRGAGPDTVIGAGTKIDNLVQIGHNVQIGKYVIITGQCGIAGSTQLGDGVMLGAQSGVAGHLTIGAGAKLAARAGVMRDVPAGETYGGTPAVAIKDWHRQTIAITQLTKKTEGSEE